MFSRQKIAQVGIFIVVAVMILFGTVAIISLNVSDKLSFDSSNGQVAGDEAYVRGLLESCIDNSIYSSLEFFGTQGGEMQFIIGENYVEFPIKTYYENSEYEIPSLQELEQDFSNVILNTIPRCVSTFSYPGFKVEPQSLPEAKVLFLEDRTKITIEYDLLIYSENEEKTTKVANYAYEYPVRVPHYLSVAGQISKKIQEDPENVEVLFLGGFDTGVLVEPVNQSFFVYSIVDDVGGAQSKTYQWNFGVDLSDLNIQSPGLNRAPQFDNLQTEHSLPFGSRFSYDINSSDPDGDKVTYSIESQQDFIINPDTGLLEFAPTSQEIGDNFVRVYIDDGKGQFSEEVIRVEVTG